MTTLRNFDTELDVLGVSRLTKTVEVTEQVVVTPHGPSEARTYVGVDPRSWTWSQLRDYVVAQIEERFGVFPRDSKKEYGIFNSFKSRWGERAGLIAVWVFEHAEGRWSGKPITVNRFCKASDKYFSAVIAERLVTQPIADW